MKVSVILPTSNESENVRVVVPRLAQLFREEKMEWGIVDDDDDSPDGTAEAAVRLSGTCPLRVHVRKGRRGLASAVFEGFGLARGDILVVMDADLSHPEEKVPEMIRPIAEGRCDATVGTRYASGGAGNHAELDCGRRGRGVPTDTACPRVRGPAFRSPSHPMGGRAGPAMRAPTGVPFPRAVRSRFPRIVPIRRMPAALAMLAIPILVFGIPSLAAVSMEVPVRKPEAGVTRLIEALEDRNSRVRAASALSLGKLGDPRAVDSLLNALGDPLDDVRNAAAVALRDLGEPLGELIHASLSGSGKDAEGRAKTAREELAKRKDPRSHQPLARALNAWNVEVRVAAAKSLGAIGDARAVEPLIKAMDGPYNPVREAAAWALFKIGDGRAIAPMIKALGDGYEPVRAAAAYSLGRWGDPGSVGPLIEALADRDVGVREGAAYSLGKIGDGRAVGPLILSLRDSHGKVREAAVWSLARLEDRRAVDPLIDALGNGVPKVREAAAWALGVLGDRRATDPLVSALGDDDPGVRKAAMQVLEKLGDPMGKRIYGALDGDRESREELARGKDPRSLDPLLRCLRNPDGKLRRAAARALGTIGDRRAVDGLVVLAGGWNLPDRVVGMSALLRIDQDVYPDFLMSVFRVALRPASVAYLLFIASAAVLARYGPGWAGRARERLSGWKGERFP